MPKFRKRNYDGKNPGSELYSFLYSDEEEPSGSGGGGGGGGSGSGSKGKLKVDTSLDIPDETIDTQYPPENYKKFKEYCRSQVPYMCGKRTENPGYCRRKEKDCLYKGAAAPSEGDKYIYQDLNDEYLYKAMDPKKRLSVTPKYVNLKNNLITNFKNLNYNSKEYNEILKELIESEKTDELQQSDILKKSKKIENILSSSSNDEKLVPIRSIINVLQSEPGLESLRENTTLDGKKRSRKMSKKRSSKKKSRKRSSKKIY